MTTQIIVLIFCLSTFSTKVALGTLTSLSMAPLYSKIVTNSMCTIISHNNNILNTCFCLEEDGEEEDEPPEAKKIRLDEDRKDLLSKII